ncbi:MAG TPA: hypothetical protein VF817_01640 [Patescibacteria group bacterium]
MGKYADIKSRKFIKLLKWLSRKKPVELSAGGKHNLAITCIHTGEKYPIACSHNLMNKHIVEHFKEWLVQRELCTEKEFDDHL